MKAKALVVAILVSQGEKLAEDGKLQEAVAKFKEAKTLDPSLDFDPYVKAKELAVPALVEKAVELMEQNKAEEAFLKYQEARELDTQLEKANTWYLNGFCWLGSLRGYAAEVMTACEMAVARDPNHGAILDSRGVARALTGDYVGAISDFEASIKRLKEMIQDTEDEDYRQWLESIKTQRQGWVDTLRKGENPLTQEVLQELWNQ